MAGVLSVMERHDEGVLSDSDQDLIDYGVIMNHPEDLIESIATLTGLVAAGLPRHSALVAAVFRDRVAN